MPLLILFLIALVTPLLVIALMPIGIVQRYRAGTARRLARPWLATLNIAALSLSVALFLLGATVTSLWVPNALLSAFAGLFAGFLLAILGLALTRWERGPEKLHYTPNRLLVLAITLLVTVRLAYGFWRLWQGWQLGGDERAWLVQSGVPGSLAAGALVLGYWLAYWIGLKRKIRRHSSSAL